MRADQQELAPDVRVRWRKHPDPDACGYIVEAVIGGVLLEGAGHYGDSFLAAQAAAAAIIAAIPTLTAPEGAGEAT
jgi:hypothetical protein